MKTQPLQFFIDRIGKRIFRDDNYCDCKDCKKIHNEGLIIKDREMAEYLYMIQNDMANEDIYLNYRDIQ